MKKPAILLAALALATVPSIAGSSAPAGSGKDQLGPVTIDPCATPINYTNVELLYAFTDFDGGGDDGHGFKLDLEYTPLQNIYVTGGAQYLDSGDVDLWTLSAGMGGYYQVNPHLHLAVDGGFLWAHHDGDSQGGGDSDSGWYARPHVRARFGCFEAHVGAIYRDLGNNSFYDSRWAVFGQVYYQLGPAWDVTAGVEHTDDAFTQVKVGARVRF